MSNVDVSAEPDLWLSISELAVSRGVTKGPLSRRVARLEEQGLLQARPGSRGSKLINVAEFDRVTNATTDIVRATNGGAAAPERQDRGGGSEKEGLVYSQEQARNASYSAELKWLELEERRKNLCRKEDVISATATCADLVVREIEGLSHYADEIAAAVGVDGAVGARRVLKQAIFELRNSIADAFGDISKNSVPGARDAPVGN
jgi:DNA-binding IscR family transcriptional regulator